MAEGELLLWAVCEHIEDAGVHSGDTTLVPPPQALRGNGDSAPACRVMLERAQNRAAKLARGSTRVARHCPAAVARQRGAAVASYVPARP